MAINKKGIVIRPKKISDLIIQILNENNREFTTDDIMRDLREIHTRKLSRQVLNNNLSELTISGKIVRVNKGNGLFNPSIYKAKPHE